MTTETPLGASVAVCGVSGGNPEGTKILWPLWSRGLRHSNHHRAAFGVAGSTREPLVGDVTYTLTRRAFDFEPLEPLTLKGIAEPVPAWRLVAERAEHDEATAELVGRREEMAELVDDLGVASHRAGRIGVVVGEPGVDKSRDASRPEPSHVRTITESSD